MATTRRDLARALLHKAAAQPEPTWPAVIQAWFCIYTRLIRHLPLIMSDSEFEEELSAGDPPTIDPYEVLGVEREATADDIKKAYRKAALRNHPGEQSLKFTSSTRH